MDIAGLMAQLKRIQEANAEEYKRVKVVLEELRLGQARLEETIINTAQDKQDSFARFEEKR